MVVIADGCCNGWRLQRMAVMTDSGWLLCRMAVATDGVYGGWLWQRMAVITDGFYNGRYNGWRLSYNG